MRPFKRSQDSLRNRVVWNLTSLSTAGPTWGWGWTTLAPQTLIFLKRTSCQHTCPRIPMSRICPKWKTRSRTCRIRKATTTTSPRRSSDTTQPTTSSRSSPCKSKCASEKLKTSASIGKSERAVLAASTWRST